LVYFEGKEEDRGGLARRIERLKVTIIVVSQVFAFLDEQGRIHSTRAQQVRKIGRKTKEANRVSFQKLTSSEWTEESNWHYGSIWAWISRAFDGFLSLILLFWYI